MNLRHLPAEFPAAERYLVGVSGGQDSVALLHLLVEAGYENLVVCHLNHQLRPESDADATFVLELAHQLQIPDIALEQEDVRTRMKRTGQSLETAAREARLEFFGRMATRYGTPRLFLAHHADDQVETMLMCLLRGAGPAGLGGMDRVSEVKGLTLIRPLLPWRRSEIPVPEAYREDASNASGEFLRNRIRHQILPELERVSGREITPSLLRTMDILRAENHWMEQNALAALEQVRDTENRLKVPGLRELPLALQRRVIHYWLQDSGVSNISFEKVEAARALIQPGALSAKINLAGDRHLRRREKLLFIE